MRRKQVLAAARRSGRKLLPVESVTEQRLSSKKIEAYLDSGAGACWFKRPELPPQQAKSGLPPQRAKTGRVGDPALVPVAAPNGPPPRAALARGGAGWDRGREQRGTEVPRGFTASLRDATIFLSLPRIPLNPAAPHQG